MEAYIYGTANGSRSLTQFEILHSCRPVFPRGAASLRAPLSGLAVVLMTGFWKGTGLSAVSGLLYLRGACPPKSRQAASHGDARMSGAKPALTKKERRANGKVALPK